MSQHKTVLVNGCFDILHPGHVFFLQQAADQGDTLVVGLNADATVEKAKGKVHRTFEERRSILYSLKSVDVVLGFKEANACALVDQVRPDVYVTGEEYRSRSPEARLVKEYGGQVVYVPRLGEYSSSKEGKK